MGSVGPRAQHRGTRSNSPRRCGPVDGTSRPHLGCVRQSGCPPRCQYRHCTCAITRHDAPSARRRCWSVRRLRGARRSTSAPRGPTTPGRWPLFCAAAGRTAFQVVSDGGPQPTDVGLKRRPGQRAVANAVPPMKQVIRVFQQRLTRRSGRAAAIDHRLEIAAQVRPTPLNPLEVPVCAPTVTGHHVEEGWAEQLLDDVPAARTGDVKDGDQRNDDRPQPGPLLVFPPTGLVEVRVLGADVVEQLVVRRRQQYGRPPLELTDHAGRDRQAEQVGKQVPHRPLAQPVHSGEQPDQRRQPRPEAPAGAPGGGSPVVRPPHRRQASVCKRYSVTWGWIGGTSATWRRSGCGSVPTSSASQTSHRGGRQSTNSST